MGPRGLGRATHGEAGRERIGRAYPPVPIAKIGNKTTEDLGVLYRNRVFPDSGTFYHFLRVFVQYILKQKL